MQRTKASFQAEEKFTARLSELGATLLDADWHGSHVKHHIRCAAGHDCYSRPKDVVKGDGICRICAGTDSATAAANFKRALEALGATLLEAEWLGKDTPHRVQCAAGHEGTTRPSNVRQGNGVCRICAGNDPQTAALNFRKRLVQLGATLIDTEWRGNQKRYRAICVDGHECFPMPNIVQQGRGICRVCSRTDPATAEAAFKKSLQEIGATLLEPKWLGVMAPHRVICVNRHLCRPRPNNVSNGAGICVTCTGCDPVVAECNFKQRLQELGITLLEPKYLGKDKPHRAICPAGHECAPRPGGIRDGEGACLTCSGHDPIVAERNFKQRLQELGITLLEPKYLGKDKPHRAICPAGHECAPRPSGIRDGEGGCATCAGKEWDAFYVVVNEELGRLKFGISSNGGTARLSRHAGKGYRKVIRLSTGMPEMAAVRMEESVKATLRLAKERPVHGTEYFDISVLALVLDIVDN